MQLVIIIIIIIIIIIKCMTKWWERETLFSDTVSWFTVDGRLMYLRVSSNCVLISTGESRNPRRITYLSAISWTYNRTWTDLGSNPVSFAERSAANLLYWINQLEIISIHKSLMCWKEWRRTNKIFLYNSGLEFSWFCSFYPTR